MASPSHSLPINDHSSAAAAGQFEGGRMLMRHVCLIITTHDRMRHPCPFMRDTRVPHAGREPLLSFGTPFASYPQQHRKTSKRRCLAIKTPRISVRTRGPTEWSIAVRQLSTAEDVRKNLRQGGLSCGEIDKDGNDFVFTVNGRCVNVPTTNRSSVSD